MSQGKNMFRIFGLLLALVCFTAEYAAAQAQAPARPAGSVKFRKLRPLYPPTPKFQTTSYPPATDTRDWLQLILEYETSGGQDGWFDDLTLEWSVLVFTEKFPRRPYLLRRNITYLDVAEGRHIEAVYIRPNFMLRYANARRIVGKDVVVRIEARVNGMKTGEVYIEDGRKQPLPPNWWLLEEPNVFLKNSELLTRPETPFADLNFDSYEFIKTGEK